MIRRDGHVRVLPIHVANKIAAGEVVERPASVVKELVENAIDAGSKNIRITITQGGRKLVSVQDDGCGMTRDDAVLSLERQATSKILDVDDIEQIDTLGFRGEAIPSIASVSRFSITTRRHESDEGTLIVVNAGQLAEVSAAGCPPGTLVEVRDLFCNVPARRKFLRAYVTEENHVKQIFIIHALAHPSIGFSLTIDGRELYRLAPSANLSDRVLDLFGKDFVAELLPVGAQSPNPNTQTPKHPNTPEIRVSGFLERPNLNQPTRRDQYIFINGRPATAPSIAYAMKEAYPRRPGEVRPAAILFIELPPTQVDVNVHPTKREVRFRDNTAVKQAVMEAIQRALCAPVEATPSRPAESAGLLSRQPDSPSPTPNDQSPDQSSTGSQESNNQTIKQSNNLPPSRPAESAGLLSRQPIGPTQTPNLSAEASAKAEQPTTQTPNNPNTQTPTSPAPLPTQVEFAVEPDSTASRPWKWFNFLAITSSNYLLIETDAGLVTINPRAARERIAYEALLRQSNNPNNQTNQTISQSLLIPETLRLSPTDFARIKASLETIQSMGFSIEEFGKDTFKIDAVPQLLGDSSPSAILSTIAQDLAEPGSKRGDKWREELIAKSIAKSFAGASAALTEAGAKQLVEELCACRMPYVCPRGKVIMIFTSTRELDRKFNRD